MTSNFDTEIIALELLELLQKQNIPTNTLALNLSMPIQEFETTFPQIKNYKAGIFYKALTINNTPVAVQVRRKASASEKTSFREYDKYEFLPGSSSLVFPNRKAKKG